MGFGVLFMAELPDNLVDLLFEVGRHGQLETRRRWKTDTHYVAKVERGRAARPGDRGARTRHDSEVKEEVTAGRREALKGKGGRTRDRKSTRLNSSHSGESRMPSSA